MTLSRRGWNNVLIFAVLAMMLIFQYSGNKMNTNKSTAYQAALPASAVVLSMQVEDINIRRVGSELEVQPALNLSQSHLQRIVKAWETATFKPLPDDVKVANLNYGINIEFALANVSEPVVLILYQVEDGYLLQNWQQQLLLIDESELQALLPR